MKACALKILFCASAAVGTYSSAYAQAAPVSQDEQKDGTGDTHTPSWSGISAGDIVVTARRREENLQDVPVAITAIRGDALIQTGVRDAVDLAKVVPSFSVIQNSGRRDVLVFELRGVSAADILLPQDPGVAVYVNDFIHARPYGLQGGLYDLESVQVLYGPQGTLFGRNSTAGAVLINTKKPSTDGYGGDFRIAVGNYDRTEFFGALNVPMGDVAALRVATDFKRRGGFTRNVTTGDKLDNMDQKAVRASLLLQPASNFSNITVVDYYLFNDDGVGNKITDARPFPTVDPEILRLTGITNYTGLAASRLGNATLAAAVADSYALGPRRTRIDALPYDRTEQKSVVNTTTMEISDNITLKNIFGYFEYSVATNQDLDGSALNILATKSFYDGKQWSNEFQVQGRFGDIDAIAGLYYFDERGLDDSMVFSFIPQVPGRTKRDISPGVSETKASAVNISKSVFAQATWKVTPSLSLTAGGRYTWDTRKTDAQSQRPADQICNVFDVNNVRLPFDNCSRKQRAKFSDPSYTLSVDYKPIDSVLVYAAHRLGYRAGGFNPRGINNATLAPFEPEKLKDYEIGLKSDFEIGRVKTRFNAAAFYSDYTNIQRTVAALLPNSSVPTTTVINAASAKIKGGEVSLTIEPVEGLAFSGNVSLVDFKVNRFNDVVTNSLVPPPNSVPVVILDQTFPVSKYQWGVNVTYNRQIDKAGTLSAVFNYKWRSASAGTGQTFPFVEAESIIPAYGLADASIRLSDVGGTPLFVGAFVENLFDKTARIGGLSLERALGYSFSFYNAPRMFGFEVGAKF